MSPDQTAARAETWVQTHLPLLVAGAIAMIVVAVLLAVAYRRYGLRLVYLLLWWALKVVGAAVALAVIGVALLVAGRRWKVPRFLRFTEEDPDRPLIEHREVRPMQLQKKRR